MNEYIKSLYKTSRENSHLTQEYAAGALHISVRQLSDYENEKGIISYGCTFVFRCVFTVFA